MASATRRSHLIECGRLMSSTLTFLGAARTVTGSRYLVEAAGRRVLVDCGMLQGLKELRLRNWAESPVPPASIDAVVLTHAHLDHCGMLPRLVAQGFKGRIFCTPGTQDLCSVVLPYAGRLQEEEADRVATTMLILAPIVIAIIALLAAIFMPYIAEVVAPGFHPEQKELLISMTRLMLISPIIFGVSNTIGSMLVSYESFVGYGASAMLYNIGIILGIPLATQIGPEGLV